MKLSVAFVSKFVIRSSCLITFRMLGFGQEVNTRFQSVISVGVGKKPFIFIRCSHLLSFVSVVNHEDI